MAKLEEIGDAFSPDAPSVFLELEPYSLRAVGLASADLEVVILAQVIIHCSPGVGDALSCASSSTLSRILRIALTQEQLTHYSYWRIAPHPFCDIKRQVQLSKPLFVVCFYPLAPGARVL